MNKNVKKIRSFSIYNFKIDNYTKMFNHSFTLPCPPYPWDNEATVKTYTAFNNQTISAPLLCRKWCVHSSSQKLHVETLKLLQSVYAVSLLLQKDLNLEFCRSMYTKHQQVNPQVSIWAGLDQTTCITQTPLALQKISWNPSVNRNIII